MTQLELNAIERCGKLLIDETFVYNDIECVVLSDAERCYIQGYKDAIEKACNWLDSNFPTIDNVGSWYKESFIKEFKKYLEE